MRVIEHALAYQALTSGTVDLIDIFSTDARLTRPGVVVLEDDRAFFPAYAAVLAARLDFVERFPAAWDALQRAMVGRIDTATMAALNAAADLDGRSVRGAAAAFLGEQTGAGDERALLTRELAVLTLLPFATLPVKIVLTPTFLDLALGGVLGLWFFDAYGRARRGEPVALATRPVTVTALEPDEKAQPAYNLVVADFHSYFVGEAKILSHDNTVREPTDQAVPGFAKQ